MLLSPVHFMNNATAGRIGYDRADSVSDPQGVIAARAASLSIPISIVHGIRDELTPAYYSSLFVSSVRESVPKQYVPIEDEGHVFSSYESWERVVATFLDFARKHLGAGAG